MPLIACSTNAAIATSCGLGGARRTGARRGARQCAGRPGRGAGGGGREPGRPAAARDHERDAEEHDEHRPPVAAGGGAGPSGDGRAGHVLYLIRCSGSKRPIDARTLPDVRRDGSRTIVSPAVALRPPRRDAAATASASPAVARGDHRERRRAMLARPISTPRSVPRGPTTVTATVPRATRSTGSPTRGKSRGRTPDSIRRSSSARCATASRRACIAATSWKPTPRAG